MPVIQLQLPRWLSSDAHSLLKSLLERNVTKRLGAGKSSMFVIRGVQALKSHSFFKVSARMITSNPELS